MTCMSGQSYPGWLDTWVYAYMNDWITRSMNKCILCSQNDNDNDNDNDTGDDNDNDNGNDNGNDNDNDNGDGDDDNDHQASELSSEVYDRCCGAP